MGLFSVDEEGEYNRGSAQTIESGISAIPIVGGIVGGILKGRRAGKVDATRPTYQRPAEIDEALAIARRRAFAPSRQAQAARAGIDAERAEGRRAAMDFGTNATNTLGALIAMDQNRVQEESQIAGIAAREEQMNVGRLDDALNTTAQYKDKEFEFNKLGKFLDRTARKRALQKASAKEFEKSRDEGLEILEYKMRSKAAGAASGANIASGMQGATGAGSTQGLIGG